MSAEAPKGLLLLHGLTSTSAMLGGFKERIDTTTPYKAQTVGGPLEVNMWIGNKRKVVDGLHRLTDQTQEKVAVVGHSLGGLHGAEAAFENPDEVDEVVTIFSPIRHLRGKPESVQATAIAGESDPVVNRRIALNPRWEKNWTLRTADHCSPLWRPPVQEFVIAQLKLPSSATLYQKSA